jgi:hypothetical protein
VKPDPEISDAMVTYSLATIAGEFAQDASGPNLYLVTRGGWPERQPDPRDILASGSGIIGASFADDLKSARVAVEQKLPGEAASYAYRVSTWAWRFGGVAGFHDNGVQLIARAAPLSLTPVRIDGAPQEAMKKLQAMLSRRDWEDVAKSYAIDPSKADLSEFLSGAWFEREMRPVDADEAGLWIFAHGPIYYAAVEDASWARERNRMIFATKVTVPQEGRDPIEMVQRYSAECLENGCLFLP